VSGLNPATPTLGVDEGRGSLGRGATRRSAGNCAGGGNRRYTAQMTAGVTVCELTTADWVWRVPAQRPVARLDAIGIGTAHGPEKGHGRMSYLRFFLRLRFAAAGDGPLLSLVSATTG
jgi:hypothetical protein